MLDSLQMHTPFWLMLLRLLIAAIFGGLVGWDREAKGRPAGLRTHILVAIGSAGFTLIAIEFYESVRETSSSGMGDPMRIVAAIVGGVGFLGAGAIIQARGEVKGVTTAAGIWAVAAVGSAAGAGYYELCFLLTVFAMATLTVVRRLEKHTSQIPHERVD